MSQIALCVVFSAEVTIRCPNCGQVVKKEIKHCVDKSAVEHHCLMCNRDVKFQFRIADLVEPQQPIFPDNRD